MTARTKFPAHVGRAMAAIFACATVAATSACTSDSSDSSSSFTSVSTTGSESTISSEMTTTSEAAVVERSADDFQVSGTNFPAFSVEFAGNPTRCVALPKTGSDVYFDCEVELSGTIPPINSDPAPQLGGTVDVIMFLNPDGFITTYDVGGGEGTPKAGTLAKNERVEAGGFTFEYSKDGTIRVEKGNRWFELDPDGQYSSDRFDPKNAPSPTTKPESQATPAEPAQEEQTVSDAEKYADLIAPGETFCTTFPYNGGVYVVSARDGGQCNGIDLLQEFVNTPITNPGQTDLYYDRGGSLWHCGYAGSGAGYCEPHGGGGGVIGRGRPAR